MNIAVVYWSGTGNTKKMADTIAESAIKSGASVSLIEAVDFNESQVDDFDRIAFGCPAMGDEVLEEEIFEPMFSSCEKKLKDKEIAIFGSYEWNTGAWMEDWAKRVKEDGAILIYEPLAAYDYPDDESLAKCRELGQNIAK